MRERIDSVGFGILKLRALPTRAAIELTPGSRDANRVKIGAASAPRKSVSSLAARSSKIGLRILLRSKDMEFDMEKQSPNPFIFVSIS